MSLSRGKYGVEFNARKVRPESSGLGWIVVSISLAALVSLAWTLTKRLRGISEEEAGAKVETPDVVAVPAIEPPIPSTSQTFQSFQPLKSEVSRRPQKLRNLLMRLEEAERRRDVEMAVTTIEAIRAMPGSPAADLDDPLARRLGSLNLRRLYGLRSAQWVKEVTVGRGDSASRIASENGSTLMSLARLNGGPDKVAKIVIGQRLFVLNHPRFSLVLHRRTRTADLSLNGKFFKRYDLQGEVKAREGAYEMPAKRQLFWSGIGAVFGTADRAELDELLPKATPILVSEL